MRSGVLITFAFAFVLCGCGGSSHASTTQAAARSSVVLHTLPGLDPPVLKVTHPATSATSPGFVFVAQKGGKAGAKGGPTIVDNEGRVRFFQQLVNPTQATDFRTQDYRGKPVLTWWQGTISKAGVGQGSYVIDDDHYRQIATVHAGNGLHGDLHEFQLTPRGTAFITVYNELPYDLSGIGGPKHGYLLDSVVQEIDVKTGKVVFAWDAIKHVPLADSLEANHEPAKDATKKRPLDYFHVNSVADGPNGDILISGRNVSTIYLLARDGHIVWRLGGDHSDFKPASAVRFFYQHNVRLHPGNLLTLFDNGGIPRMEPHTRPLELKLDLATRTAKIVRTFVAPGKYASPFEGNLELLPNGGAFVGWGGIRKVTEFSPAGQEIFELELPYGDTYRGYRLPWQGTPSTPPLAARAGKTVYASWNGSTQTVRWAVLGGDSTSSLKRIATAPWRGLETAIIVPGSPKVVEVQALDAAGAVLATSAPVKS